MTIFLAFFKASFEQFFDIRLAIFRRVRSEDWQVPRTPDESNIVYIILQLELELSSLVTAYPHY